MSKSKQSHNTVASKSIGALYQEVKAFRQAQTLQMHRDSGRTKPPAHQPVERKKQVA
jgi:hypothetical protein